MFPIGEWQTIELFVAQKGMTTGSIIGLVCGSIFIVLGSVVLLLFVVKKSKMKSAYVIIDGSENEEERK